jgi:hypothetical protein
VSGSKRCRQALHHTISRTFVKCLNREEFIFVGWSDPEGSRHRLGSLLLAYYTPDGKLIYAGRAGTGMSDKELERLWRKLRPLATDKMPLAEPPPRGSRFGTPLVLSRVHWVRPEMVVEVSYRLAGAGRPSSGQNPTVCTGARPLGYPEWGKRSFAGTQVILMTRLRVEAAVSGLRSGRAFGPRPAGVAL